MDEIKTLQDLETAVGKDGVSRLFTEYRMTLVGKADKLDEVISVLKADGTINDIKELR